MNRGLISVVFRCPIFKLVELKCVRHSGLRYETGAKASDPTPKGVLPVVGLCVCRVRGVRCPAGFRVNPASKNRVFPPETI